MHLRLVACCLVGLPFLVVFVAPFQHSSRLAFSPRSGISSSASSVSGSGGHFQFSDDRSRSLFATQPDGAKSDVESTALPFTESRGLNGSRAVVSPAPPFVTPNQILHPAFFSDDQTGYDLALPLNDVLDLLRKSLRVLSSEDKADAIPAVTTTTTSLAEGEQVGKQRRILRIEHIVARNVDALGWLHSQTSSTSDLARSSGLQQRRVEQSVMYFLNQEADFEVACLGSSLTIGGNRASRHDSKGSEEDALWEFWHDLPVNAHFYGGERFDKEVEPTMISDEWKAFGRSFWILPMIELRVKEGVTTVAVQLFADASHDDSTGNPWKKPALEAIILLEKLDDQTSPAVPPTTIPPVLSRDSNYGSLDGQNVYEEAVSRALEQMRAGELEKVVLARKRNMHFGVCDWNSLDAIRRWKYGGHEGGHLFWLRPGTVGVDAPSDASPVFFGCAPERLFQVDQGVVRSEALAGSRPRGSTQKADEELLRDLFNSPKDRREIHLAGRCIESALSDMVDNGWVDWEKPLGDNRTGDAEGFFVRRLLHLQHICKQYSARLKDKEYTKDVSEYVLQHMQPPPGVCGVPLVKARNFIRDFETSAFDRGFYAGPLGYVGRDSADFVVSLRSALVTHSPEAQQMTVSVYAGAGIVPGSTPQGEWAETNYKLEVVSSLFPQ